MPSLYEVKPIGQSVGEDGSTIYDYSHLVPQEHAGKYRIEVSEDGGNSNDSWDGARFYTKLIHVPTQKQVGYADGIIHIDSRTNQKGIGISNIYITDRNHIKMGLGKAMLEASVGHAAGKHGAGWIWGDDHTRDARHAHMSMAKKYGLDYKDEQQGPGVPSKTYPQAPPDPYHYNFEDYMIKSENTLTKTESPHTVLTNGRYAVYHLKPTKDGIHKHLASVFAIKNGGFHLLEDYGNLFIPYHTQDGDVPDNLMQHRIKNLVNNSAYYKVIPTKEDNVKDSANRHKVVTPQDINSGRQAFVYHSPEHNGPAQLVFDKGSFHLNGYPLSIAELKHIRDSVDQGHSHISYPDDMFKSESLEKMAVLPKDIKVLVRGTDLPSGEATVDHTGHLTSFPDSVRPSVELYESGIKADPKSSKISMGEGGRGASRKSFFKVGGTRSKPSRTIPSIVPQDDRFMLKPYHESIETKAKNWMRANMQGWAEMANQALYHAGGIGDLHQKVFVTENETEAGNKIPLLSVHMGANFDPIAKFWHKRSMIHNNQNAQDQVRKIAIMDFLTNNLDRHAGNLMFNEKTGNLLAIDHSRSFQYLNKDKVPLDKRRNMGDDSLAHYLGYNNKSYQVGLGISLAMHRSKDPYEFAESFIPTMEWWKKNSDSIRNEMNSQLKHIRDEKLRHHIKVNFEARAHLLDDFAKHGIENFGQDFYNTGVELTRPWEH